MKINPPTTKIILFSGGGGLIERSQKVRVTQGINQFEIENVPAAFDPTTTNIFFPNLNPEIALIQVDVKRPDKKIIDNYIERERNAADAIIHGSTDLRGTSRDIINQLIESAYYRRYEDMPGLIIATIEAKVETEIALGVKYFLEDSRIKWSPSLHVKIDEKSHTASVEGYILVINNTDMDYPMCDIAFAEFEMNNDPTESGFLQDLEEEQQQQTKIPQNRMVPQMKKVKHLLF
jgi:hypothetical protein